MTDLVAQQLNGTNRWEIPTEARVRGIGRFRKNEPDTVVLRIPDVISKHEDEQVTDVHRES